MTSGTTWTDALGAVTIKWADDKRVIYTRNGQDYMLGRRRFQRDFTFLTV